MKIEQVERVKKTTSNKMVIGEVYRKDPNGEYCIAAQTGIVYLFDGSTVEYKHIHPQCEFTHCPDAKLVV